MMHRGMFGWQPPQRGIRGPQPPSAASLPPSVAATCATISTVGGAGLTVIGVMYPLVETYLTVKRLEKIEGKVAKEVELIKLEQKEMSAVLKKVADKLKIA